MITEGTKKREELEDVIRCVLDRNQLAVLATQRAGQPHTSLMAFSFMDDLQMLVFATYRNTRKYQNLMDDGRVALLVCDGIDDAALPGRRVVITAVGQGSEVPDEACPSYTAIHLARHPDLKQFLDSPDCALVRVAVEAYQVVTSIDDVQWYRINDPKGL